jgi:hypothetical protein
MRAPHGRLPGLIWQFKNELAFDAAFRYALVNGHPVNEIRAGMTFAFKVESGNTPMKPGVTFGNLDEISAVTTERLILIPVKLRSLHRKPPGCPLH